MTFSTTKAQRPPLHASLPKIRGATAKSKHTTLPKLVGCPSEPSQTRLTTQRRDQKADLNHHLESRGLVSGGRVGLPRPGTVPALPAVPSPYCVAHRKPPTKEMAQHLALPPAHRAKEKAHFKEVKRLLFCPKKMKQEKALISGPLLGPLALLHFAISRSWV